MVHVEYTAEGTEYEQTHDRDFADGSDRKIESVRVRRDVEVEAYIELPGGHVNLEAYAPSHDPEGVAERLQHNYTPVHLRAAEYGRVRRARNLPQVGQHRQREH